MIMSLDIQHSYNITVLFRFVPLLRYRDRVARELVLTRIRVLPGKHDKESGKGVVDVHKGVMTVIDQGIQAG